MAAIEDLIVREGSLPPRTRGLVIEWVTRHHEGIVAEAHFDVEDTAGPGEGVVDAVDACRAAHSGDGEHYRTGIRGWSRRTMRLHPVHVTISIRVHHPLRS